MSLDYTDPSKKALANFGTKALVLTGIISFIFLIFACYYSKPDETISTSNEKCVVIENEKEYEINYN